MKHLQVEFIAIIFFLSFVLLFLTANDFEIRMSENIVESFSVEKIYQNSRTNQMVGTEWQCQANVMPIPTANALEDVVAAKVPFYYIGVFVILLMREQGAVIFVGHLRNCV